MDGVTSIYISIHAPREGGDMTVGFVKQSTKVFQSTPPARGATTACALADLPEVISIHAPREGGDVKFFFSRVDIFYFNPRPPRGGRRRLVSVKTPSTDFNPRPPRGGRRRPTHNKDMRCGFQSTPPARGATISSSCPSICFTYFNPRPPRGGRLQQFRYWLIGNPISIHAPREGGDF